MSDFQIEMNKAVEGFVAQIAELARRAAIGTLESAFSGRAGRANGAAVLLAAGKGTPVRARRGRSAKRTAADLEALSSQVATFVKAKPGLRIEEINKELGTTKDLALPIRKLIADGILTTKGEKRSTTYFPGRKAK
jgi:hypothetical protein